MAEQEPTPASGADYDPHLQMFKRTATLNKDVLMVWRIRAEKGTAGRTPEGKPAGDIALGMVIQTGLPIEKIMDRRRQPKTQYEQQH